MSVRSVLSHFFLPKESNRHKAHILHWEFILVLAVILFFGNKFINYQSPQILGFANQISPQEVIRLTNVQRVAAGLGVVSENSLLDKAASEKAADMFAKGYWAHVAPDGTQPWDFFKSVGYKYKYAGENLARDFNSPGSAVDAWMASPSHRDNMLNSKYKDIGVAVLDGSLDGHDATIVVQLFGSLAADRPQVPIAAAAETNKVASPEATIKVASAEATIKEPETQVSAAQVPPPSLTVNSEPLIPELSVAKLFSASVIAVLILALIFDTFVVWRRDIKRNSSRSVAQIAFLVMILAIILVAKAGQII